MTHWRRVREVLAESWGEASDLDLEDELPVDDLDDLLESWSQVGQVAQRALPGVVQGAVTGAMVGGPVGAVVGGVAGGLGSSGALRGAPAPTAPSVGAQPVVAPAAASPPTAALNAAALQLLSTILRPEVGQALVSLALGPNGAPAVQVGQSAVPVTAFADLLRSLAASALAQASTPTTSAPAPSPARLVEMLDELVPADEDDDAFEENPYDEDLDEDAEAADLAELYYGERE